MVTLESRRSLADDKNFLFRLVLVSVWFFPQLVEKSISVGFMCSYYDVMQDIFFVDSSCRFPPPIGKHILSSSSTT